VILQQTGAVLRGKLRFLIEKTAKSAAGLQQKSAANPLLSNIVSVNFVAKCMSLRPATNLWPLMTYLTIIVNITLSSNLVSGTDDRDAPNSSHILDNDAKLRSTQCSLRPSQLQSRPLR